MLLVGNLIDSAPAAGPREDLPVQALYPAPAAEPASADLALLDGLPSASSDGTVAPAAAFTCGSGTFETHGDYVHVSSGDVSGHGWWVNISCPFPQADVKVQLQAYYSDGVWRNVGAYGKKRVYSGGGSANRANARVNCSSFGEYYSYRSWVDVDIVGANDPSGVGYTPTRNLRCHL